MDEQENCSRITRAAAKKRASAALATAPSVHLPATKKRVVLGEISNIMANPSSNLEPQKPKRRFKKKDQKKVVSDIVANSDNPQMCASYASDIYQYLHIMEKEVKRRPLLNYLEQVQKDVTANMRGVLVDWLVEVAEEYKLLSDTLFLTVSYIDRFLSLHTLNRQRLQLLGVSSMLIASKYEEISPPHVEDFCYITDNTYTKGEVVKMEKDILNFLKRFTRAVQENCKSPDLQLEYLGWYLAELSLLDYGCVRFLPSVIAASVVFLSNFTMQPKKHPWSLTLQHCLGYRPSELKECVLALHDLQLNRRGSSLVSVRDKYKQHKFKSVATLSSPPEIPIPYFEDVKE
ncbi:hypothetical protein HHK36_009833 [Tetracentron sinense]|uniref:Cyclin A n=1 Tax=Tetracentron sinense TaxID=13715 RepID=A0A835DIJ9_TETSI|nr:hypothetical protein HHK36_009833 [Tetracentron sinense]